MTDADYALQKTKGIRKVFNNAMQNYIEEYMKQGYIKFYNTSEISEIYTSVEGITGAKKLGKLETPPSMALEDGYSVTIVEERFGGGVILPENVYRRDKGDTTQKVENFLMEQRNQQLLDNKKLLCTNAHLMLNEAFSSTSDYLAPDAVEVCGSHSWASGGTFDNAETELLDEDAANTADDYAGAVTDPAGKEDPLTWTHLVVKKGTPTSRMAMKLYAKEIQPTAINDVNIYEGSLTVIETPYITHANRNYHFYMDLSRRESPLAVGIGDYPTMREPKVESNEAIRANVTGFWKQGVINMPIQILGRTGTT